MATAFLLTPVSQAQTSASQTTLPDAPSASAKDAATEPSGGDGFVDILLRKSLFFPNLATTTRPLTSGEKFKLFMGDSVSGGAFLGAIFGAAVGQAADSPAGYGQGGEGYAKRFGSSMARNASKEFFGTFLLASLLHQDPRFFVVPSEGFKEPVGHALKSVFVTHSDSGKKVTNWSGLLGPLLAEGLANAYLPPDAQTAGKTFQRYGTDMASKAASNILRQYWPKILEAAHLKHRGATTVAPAPSSRPDPSSH